MRDTFLQNGEIGDKNMTLRVIHAMIFVPEFRPYSYAVENIELNRFGAINKIQN